MHSPTAARHDASLTQQPTLLGHPVGLFTLFFAEMWERFSYYGMRALLLLYMGKGFLQYPDSEGYAVYGAYTALVYMTPFVGGMLADRLLGTRRAVVFGGILMAAGHLSMAFENVYFFFTGLALLIAGNGFFKPNISTIVGTLYGEKNVKRDAGFTIFYMGINLGAAMSPLLCGYIGEQYGFHYGFGLATIGMITGLAVFVAPNIVAQGLIAGGALLAAFGLCYYHPDHIVLTAVNVFVALALLASATLACIAIQRGGLPKLAGAPPDPALLKKPVVAGLSMEWAVYLVTLLVIPLFVLLVSGFAPLRADKRGVVLIPETMIKQIESNGTAVSEIAAVVLKEVSRPAGLILFTSGIVALGYLVTQLLKLDKVPRQRMYVVLILTFFSMLFWAFFEQAGSSITNFTDRNIDRVAQATDVRRVSESDVGQTLQIKPTQEQLGYKNGGQLFTLDQLNQLRQEHDKAKDNDFAIDWTVTEDNVGMVIVDRNAEIPASMFQSVNAIFILIFGLIFSAMWAKLALRGLEPSTPLKFALGILQVGLGFFALWYGAKVADSRGMVAIGWLLAGYLLHTTGELCLSPVGLSMISKLSPKFLVATTMGTWFLATAFSQFLAAIIAQFTSVSHEAESNRVPPPLETVNVYGDVFFQIGVAASVSAAICFVLVPQLKKWMHSDVTTQES